MRAARLVLVAVVVGSCAEAPRDPTPLRVEPASGPAASPVPLEVLGAFEAAAHVDFGSRAQGSLDDRFRARLTCADETVELEDVALVGPGTLGAVVPAGIAEREWALEVVDPRGRRGTLERAYRSLSPADAVARLQFAPIGPQRAGVPFSVTVTAVDSSGRVVASFGAEARLADPSGALPASVNARFSGGRLTARVTFARATAEAALTVDAGAGRSATSAAFSVQAGHAAALSLAAAPARVRAGACAGPFVVRLVDAGGAPAEVPAPEAVRLGSAPQPVGFFADASCSLPLGAAPLSEAGEASFYLVAARSGPGTLRLSAASVPSLEARLSVDQGPASGLAFARPSPVVRTGECSGRVELTGVGADGLPADVTSGVPLRLLAPDGLELFDDPKCSRPAAPLWLRPGAATVSLFVSAAGAGRYVLAANAGALGAATLSVIAVP